MRERRCFQDAASVVFLALLVQFLLLAREFPVSELFSETPLLHIDSAFHWFEISEAQALWAGHRLVGYNPWFAAGYADGVNYNASAKFPALLAALLSPWLSASVAYKLYSFGSAWLAPACVPVAMRLLRADIAATSATTVFGILLWWISGLHWYHTAGMVSYVFSCYAALPYIALIWRGITEPLLPRHVAALALYGAVGLAYHPLFPLPVLFCVPALAALSWERVKARQMLILLAVVPPLCLLPNLSWILPSLHYGGLASSQPFQKAIDITIAWQEALGRIEGYARGARINPVLWLFALGGLGVTRDGQWRRMSLAFVLAAGALILFAATGAALPKVGAIQPNRLSMAAYLLLAIPAGLGISAMARTLAARHLPLPVPVGSVAALLLMSVFFAKELARELSWADGPRHGAHPPEVKGLGDISRRLLDWLGRNTNAEARVLFETSLGRIHDGAHMAGYLALNAQREFIGGPYVHMHHAGFWDGFVFGRKIAAFTSGEFAERLALYNIGWVIVHSAPSKEFLDRQPGISVRAEQGPLKVYEVAGPRSFFVEGAGRVAGRGFNRLDLQDLSGPAVTLKYHYVPGMAADPPVKLEPVLLQNDPEPFVRIIAPPPAATLSLR